MDIIKIVEKGFKSRVEETGEENVIVDTIAYAISILEYSQENALFYGDSLLLSYDLLIDFHVFLLGFTPSVNDKDVLFKKLDDIFVAALQVAKDQYPSTHQTRLSFVLKYISHAEFCKNHTRAYTLALEAVRAINDIKIVVPDESTKLVQDLKDKFILTSVNVEWEILKEQHAHANEVYHLLSKHIMEDFIKDLMYPPPPPHDLVDPALWYGPGNYIGPLKFGSDFDYYSEDGYFYDPDGENSWGGLYDD